MNIVKETTPTFLILHTSANLKIMWAWHGDIHFYLRTLAAESEVGVGESLWVQECHVLDWAPG